MASPELSPWAFSLVHFDGIDRVQVNKNFSKPWICRACSSCWRGHRLAKHLDCTWMIQHDPIYNSFRLFFIDFCSSALKERSDVIERAAIPVTRRVSLEKNCRYDNVTSPLLGLYSLHRIACNFRIYQVLLHDRYLSDGAELHSSSFYLSLPLSLLKFPNFQVKRQPEISLSRR